MVGRFKDEQQKTTCNHRSKVNTEQIEANLRPDGGALVSFPLFYQLEGGIVDHADE